MIVSWRSGVGRTVVGPPAAPLAPGVAHDAVFGVEHRLVQQLAPARRRAPQDQHDRACVGRRVAHMLESLLQALGREVERGVGVGVGVGGARVVHHVGHGPSTAAPVPFPPDDYPAVSIRCLNPPRPG